MNATPLRRSLPLLFALPLLSGCMMNLSHFSEEQREPTEEELLDLYTTTATYLYDDGSLVRAQDQAVKALELDPDHRAMRRMIGWIRLRMGKSEDLLIAEDFFRGLLRDGDENDATVLGLATTLERLGTGYDQAARRVADGTQPPERGRGAEETAADYRARAEAYWREAIERYRGTLEGGEGSTAAMNGLQRSHALAGEFEQSLAWSERLLERAAAELETWRRLLTGADLTRDEEQLYRENERIAQDLAIETHLFAATLLNSIGRKQEAITHLDEVARAAPEMPQVYSRRAQLLAQTGDPERAIRDLDRFLALSDAPFEDASIRRAFELRAECEAALADAR